MKILKRLIAVILFPILLMLVPVEIIIWTVIWILTGKFINVPLCICLFTGLDDIGYIPYLSDQYHKNTMKI